MLSILIPVFNRDVTKLVEKVVKQCDKAGIFFQVLVFDDGSKSAIREKNAIVNSWFGVNYVELSENIGRSKIRNRLGSLAAYEYSLFLDCDVKVGGFFIKNYLAALEEKPDASVWMGGIRYSKQTPGKGKKLHWLYGLKRESKSARARKKNPSLNFLSSNFLVKTSVFRENLFDVAIEGYGYEDTLWAQNLENKGHIIHHIDNPVAHLGLENSEVFLEKTRSAIHNLYLLHNQGKIKNTRLLNFYSVVKSIIPPTYILKVLERKRSKIEANLHSSKPSMWYLDLWKLAEFIKKDLSI